MSASLLPSRNSGSLPPGSSLSPAFDLKRHSEVIIGRDPQLDLHVVERRVADGRWQFMSVERGTPLFKSDEQLAKLMQEGEFAAAGGRRGGFRIFAASPLSPLAIGPDAHAANLRKHEYVMACVRAPGGLTLSRRVMVPILADVARRRGEAKPPSFTGVRDWIDEYQRHGDVYGTGAYSDRHDLKGSHSKKLQPYQEQAVGHGIEQWFLLGRTKPAYDIVCDEIRKFDADKGHLIDKVTLGRRFVDDFGNLKPPSFRTFQRRCHDVNRFEKDWALVGPAYAKKKNRTYQRVPLPDRPFSHVEVDHWTANLSVVDKRRLLYLGRPDLIFFRDRATAMLGGYGLGFESPSYASFVQGLRHTMYPKDRHPWSKAISEWPCFGRIENLYVDNALHFIGDNIRVAATELGIHQVRFQPRQPWLKGSLERLNDTVGTQLVDTLPGSTLGDFLKRRDHEHLGDPVLTLEEFEALLDWWIRDVYHQEPTKSLGIIRGVGDVPIRMWAEKAEKYRVPLLPHPDVFIGLAGDSDRRTIQNDGISWDRITYESPDLWALRSHPDHRRPDDRGGSTSYEVIRDPFDLGQISVIDPYHGREILKIPATLAHSEYATGLSLHQHQVILSNVETRPGQKVVFDDLLTSRANIARAVASMSRSPGRKKTQAALARYLHVEQSRRHQSQMWVAEPPASDSDFMSLEGRPPAPVPFDDRPYRDAGTIMLPLDAHAPDDAELDDIRRRKNWNIYNDKQ